MNSITMEQLLEIAGRLRACYALQQVWHLHTACCLLLLDGDSIDCLAEVTEPGDLAKDTVSVDP